MLTLSGSPSPDSRTSVLLRHTQEWLVDQEHEVLTLHVRDLPTSALLVANTEHPAIRHALGLVRRADGLIVASPVYRAAYSGLVKAFLDLLPDGALAGKVVAPLATGGTQGHLVAMDYSLRPMLSAMGADNLVPGCFVLDRLIQLAGEGGAMDSSALAAVHVALSQFGAALGARHRLPVVA
ncbi:NADPH-dependent FMN reductase [Kutzneria viridogrisea]|uniref:NADPH-dependent FMN reductase n=1 Tax=Kutzneria TaxID=43356 RepID=UPI001EEF6632|nr:NADPH-dependent FMN reductase [Kutzneria albida]